MPGLIDPFGQRIDSPKRVMVFVEEHSGKMHGWEVSDGGFGFGASFRIGGLHTGSTHAEIRAAGEFSRIARDQQSLAIQAAIQDRADEIEERLGPIFELEAGRD